MFCALLSLDLDMVVKWQSTLGKTDRPRWWINACHVSVIAFLQLKIMSMYKAMLALGNYKGPNIILN